MCGRVSSITATARHSMPTDDDEPAWLQRWRGEDAAKQPAQPGLQRQSQGASRGSGSASDQRVATPRVNTGFSEPEPWAYDGGKRREPVLDMDRNPPRVVRFVGWRSCLKCSRPYWSEDVTRLRMCNGCKAALEYRNPSRVSHARTEGLG
jgi:hypothetical protein